jgi:hypothetical protein
MPSTTSSSLSSSLTFYTFLAGASALLALVFFLALFAAGFTYALTSSSSD